MIEIVFFTDPHVSLDPPACRSEEYYSMVLGKIEKVIEASNSIGAYPAMGGDLLHRKGFAQNAPALINDLLDVLQKSKKPVYAVVGNHDIPAGTDIRDTRSQILGIMERAGAIRLLDGTNPVLLEDGEGLSASLSGLPHDPSLDSCDAGSLYSPRHLDADIKVGIFHQMILPDNVSVPGGSYTSFEGLKGIESDIVLSGHFHAGFKAEKAHGKWFVNPGSLGRVSVRETHTPSFAHICISGDGVSVSYERLEGTQDAGEAFFHKEPMAPSPDAFSDVYGKDKNSEGIQEFVRELGNFNAFNSSEKTPRDIVHMLVRDYGMPQRLEGTAIKYLEGR